MLSLHSLIRFMPSRRPQRAVIAGLGVGTTNSDSVNLGSNPGPPANEINDLAK